MDIYMKTCNDNSLHVRACVRARMWIHVPFTHPSVWRPPTQAAARADEPADRGEEEAERAAAHVSESPTARP
jgi:hypothetical protein